MLALTFNIISNYTSFSILDIKYLSRLGSFFLNSSNFFASSGVGFLFCLIEACEPLLRSLNLFLRDPCSLSLKGGVPEHSACTASRPCSMVSSVEDLSTTKEVLARTSKSLRESLVMISSVGGEEGGSEGAGTNWTFGAPQNRSAARWFLWRFLVS